MNKLTRRTFGKRLLATSSLPFINLPSYAEQTANPELAIPDTIAGYKLTAEDKQLAGRFLANHEKNMSALREKELPNSLAPAFMFASPRTKSETKSQ